MPNPTAYKHRKQAIRVLNAIEKDLYESDLDVSINFRSGLLVFHQEQKRKTLWKFAKKLYSLQSTGRLRNVQPIMRAKVLIHKFIELWPVINACPIIQYITLPRPDSEKPIAYGNHR